MIVRQLSGLPATGPLSVNFSDTGQGTHREGSVFEFSMPCGEVWIGNFQPGLGDRDYWFEQFGGKHILIIAKGQVYFIDATRKICTKTLSCDIGFALYVPSIDAVVLQSTTAFEAIQSDRSLWKSKRVSWDGFKNVKVDENKLFGDAYSPIENHSKAAFKPFELNLIDGSFIGGSYP